MWYHLKNMQGLHNKDTKTCIIYQEELHINI